MIVDTLLVSADGTSCGASMVKMSVDFPNEAAGCQRFLSGRAQSNYARGGKHGPAAMRSPDSFPPPLADPRALIIRAPPRAESKLSPCDLDQNTRNKDRVRRTDSS